MEIDIFIILVFIASFLGGTVAALLGWVGTDEPFVPRKFITSIIKAVVGAAIVAVAFDYSGTTNLIMLLVAFLSGAGIDAAGKRVSNAITNTTNK